jgi:hypothetical protein
MRYGCRDCGSPLWWGDHKGRYVELHLGSFDEPGGLTPEYEIWTIHREPWLPSFGLPQYQQTLVASNPGTPAAMSSWTWYLPINRRPSKKNACAAERTGVGAV